MKKSFILLAVVAVFFTACEPNSGFDEPNSGNQTEKPVDKITVTPSTITTNYEDGDYEVMINSSCSWSAYSLDNWIKVKTTAGTANTKSLQFSVTRNSLMESRKGIIIIENEDQSITKEIHVIQSALEYKIGDIVSVKGIKGVVFYTDETITKLISIAESDAGLWWSNQFVATGATSDYNGAENMKKIKALDNWETRYPAFRWCSDLGEGWYLPAKNELADIFKQALTINSVLEENGYNYISDDDFYWSSTDAQSLGNETAYAILLNNLWTEGIVVTDGKRVNCLVRAVYVIEN